ncbi:MAG: PepSY-associated TM helix domain-containing protein [Alphaproteobacteria bacterium]
MSLRSVLFQLHLWTGLMLGILFALIALSGSLLMLGPVTDLDTGKPSARVSTTGAPLPLEDLVAHARRFAGAPATMQAKITLPQAGDRAADIHFGGWNSPVPNILVDPVSGDEVARYYSRRHPALAVLADLHSHIFMGRTGRILTGWLGIAMLGLGVSGLYLWWPRKARWRHAFLVGGKPGGLRFYRDLHGALGIWSLLLFFVVTISGVGLVFHESARATLAFISGSSNTPERDFDFIARVTVQENPAPIGGWQAVALAEAGAPRIIPTSVILPNRPDQSIKVQLGDWTGKTVYVDPYRAKLIEDPQPPSKVDKLVASMALLHVGDGLGQLYWLLTFITGFAPLLFFITGFMLWSRKRQNRLSMSQPLADPTKEFLL